MEKVTPIRPPQPLSSHTTQSLRTTEKPDELAHAIMDNLFYIQARIPRTATRNDWYMALAYTVRDRILRRWMNTIENYMTKQVKSISYFSAEFLMGPQLGNNIINLGLGDVVRSALNQLGQNLDELLSQEEEPGLGNGGLGRLAACFLDSCATLELLAVGYGIRYEFGIFDQEIHNGWQIEVTDKWLRLGNPWEIPRPEITYSVYFDGHTTSQRNRDGQWYTEWIPGRVIRGVAYDTAVPGYNVKTVNLLRLWKSEAVESFDFQAFNIGNYYGAVEQKMESENISKVLYPNDVALRGKQLRLEQQYFFVSCSLQDMLRVHLLRGNNPETFYNDFAIQLNDTHPAIAVAELMRLLLDDHNLEWDVAWYTTQQTLAYTNHTLLPEALEKWPLPLFAKLLPRLLEIIYEINHRFLDEVRSRFPDDPHRLARLSIIDETHTKYIRMANLASVACHSINGVAALHTQLLKQDVLMDFYAMYPEKFLNITNGVTPRRFVVLSNPKLTELLNKSIGDMWISNMQDEIYKLEAFATQDEFQDQWRRIKIDNKKHLAEILLTRTGIKVDPYSLFDIQVKRIHEYKRQHLNVLHVITRYLRLKQNPGLNVPPRTVIYGGKAAPGYDKAKLIIKLINSVAAIVNNDPDTNNKLKVVFLPDFNVKHAQSVYPAADLSEQISTAGKEASGTGNMKFAMNGALTIGTLDGANVEIRDAVGEENFFLFGLNSDQVAALKADGYNPRQVYDTNSELRTVLDLLLSGHFSYGDKNLFKPLIDSLIYHDEYMLLADYQSYLDCQDQVDQNFLEQKNWTVKTILNVARMGAFSSDRSILEYATKIWNTKPVKIKID